MRKLVKGFWKLMKDKDVNEFVLQVMRILQAKELYEGESSGFHYIASSSNG
jgi:hypothetical protein